MSDITPPEPDDYGGVHKDLVALLEAARHAAARSVNALMTASYPDIGRCIVKFEHGGHARAEYLSHSREQWNKPGKNPPLGLLLCTTKGSNDAPYALDGLSFKVMAAEYQTVLPDPRLFEAELDGPRLVLEARRIGRGDVGFDE